MEVLCQSTTLYVDEPPKLGDTFWATSSSGIYGQWKVMSIHDDNMLTAGFIVNPDINATFYWK